MLRLLTRTTLIAAAFASACVSRSQGQTVEFRMREMTGQCCLGMGDNVLDFVVEGRVTGASTPTGIASFGLNIFYWGGESSGAMARLRINTADGSLYTGAPTTGTAGGTFAGLAYEYRMLVNQNATNNGVANPPQSASGFTNTSCAGELSGIRGAIESSALLLRLDVDADGIPDSSPFNGSGQPVPNGSLAPLTTDAGAPYFGSDGNWVHLYRFRFTHLSGPRQTITLHASETPTVFSQVQRTTGGWEPVAQPATLAPVLSRWDAGGWFGAFVDLCPPDYNGQNSVTVQDIFDFLNAWFSSCNPSFCPRTADYNCSGAIDPQDIFDFLNDWFVGCP